MPDTYSPQRYWRVIVDTMFCDTTAYRVFCDDIATTSNDSGIDLTECKLQAFDNYVRYSTIDWTKSILVDGHKHTDLRLLHMYYARCATRRGNWKVGIHYLHPHVATTGAISGLMTTIGSWLTKDQYASYAFGADCAEKKTRALLRIRAIMILLLRKL